MRRLAQAFLFGIGLIAVHTHAQVRSDLSWDDLLISVQPPAPHTMPLAAGVRAIVRNVTPTQFELWFEDTPPGVTTNLDYNDIVLVMTDWGDGTTRITLSPFGDGGNHSTHSDLVDGRTNEIIWPNLYQPDGTAAGTYLFINGRVVVNSPIADIDRNGVVDRADFKTLLDHYGFPGTYSEGDINRDGMVDFVDFQKLELTFGDRITPTVVASPTPRDNVPEPGLLVAIPALALIKRRAARSQVGDCRC